MIETKIEQIQEQQLSNNIIVDSELNYAIDDIDNRLSDLCLDDPYGGITLLKLARVLKEIIERFGGNNIC